MLNCGYKQFFPLQSVSTKVSEKNQGPL